MGGDLVGLEPPTSGLELGWYVQQDEWEGMGFVVRQTRLAALVPAAPAWGRGPVPSLGQVGKAWKEAQL